MTHYKLHLDNEGEEDFILIAIHCSEEAYKMAFMLNKQLAVQLQRKRNDLKLISGEEIASFSLFEYENESKYSQYYLVENKCKISTGIFQTEGGLFEDGNSEKVTVAHLFPEFNKVDFFLKIESDIDQFPLRKTLAQINEIKEVISAYVVDNHKIKTQNNLIFN